MTGFRIIMPELPEIETVRRVVGPQVEGRTFVSVRAADNRILANTDPPGLSERLTGRTVVSVGRRGKALLLYDDLGGHTVIRFGMTGQLYVCPPDTAEERHTHEVFLLDDGMELRYVDPRRFGHIWHFRRDEEDTSGIGGLGLEPDDPGLDAGYLKDRLGRRSITVKEGLLDQTVVAGIGNIWSDEMLFEAGICPLTPCRDLTDGQFEDLAHVIPDIISFAIGKNAVSREEYLEGRGRRYYDIGYLGAYGHEGDPCPRCGKTFVRDTAGGRGTCWCPGCQRR